MQYKYYLILKNIKKTMNLTICIFNTYLFKIFIFFRSWLQIFFFLATLMTGIICLFLHPKDENVNDISSHILFSHPICINENENPIVVCQDLMLLLSFVCVVVSEVSSFWIECLWLCCLVRRTVVFVYSMGVCVIGWLIC